MAVSLKISKIAKPAQTVQSTPDTATAPAESAPKVKKVEPTPEIVAKAESISKKKKSIEPKAKAPKHAKPHKPKMIRDSFAMPEDDYSKLDLLKSKCLENGVEVKKSELLRAGLAALSRMPINTLIKVVREVERLKTGRPKKSGSAE